MRFTAGVVAGLILALGAASARAEDWRAVSTSHHDLVFVDADSVRRESDGRIAFRARHRLAQNDSNRDFGYDRIDLAVTGRCRVRGADLPPAGGTRKYFLRNRAVEARDWREEDLSEEIPVLADMVCRGELGHRRWADLDRAMAEYDDHDSLERLAAHVTGERELTGIVVQGFEMNAVSLCGEGGCREDGPRETCWLEGDVHVPTPAGAPDGVGGGPRRDSAGAAFTGRIYRSRSRRGFGHMGAMSCLVEVTGPARFVEIDPQRPEPAVDYGEPGRRPGAVAAHAAFVESIRAAASVELGSDDRRWTIDDFSPAAASPSGGACYSLPKFADSYVPGTAPALGWPETRRIVRDGASVTLVSDVYDGDLDLNLPDAESAGRMAAYVRRLSKSPVASVAQKGSRVTIGHSTGAREEFRFADAALAVQAAGVANRLLGREVRDIKTIGANLIIRRAQRLTLTFPDEAKAAEAERRMEALRSACAYSSA